MDIGGAISAITRPFRKPEGYVSAKDQAAASAPAPVAAPAAPKLGGVNMNAMQRREKAAGLADGIAAVPGKRNGNKDTVPAMLTPGEGVLPVDTVDAIGGPAAVQSLIDATHTPLRRKGPISGMANGGEVEDRAVFGLYPNVTGGSRRATHATDAALRTGVVATGPTSFQPAPISSIATGVRRPLPGGVEPSAAGAGRGTVNPSPAIQSTQVMGASAPPAGAVSRAAAVPAATPGIQLGAVETEQAAVPVQTSQDRIDTYNRAGQTYREISAMQLEKNQTPAGMGMVVLPDGQAERNAQFDAKTMRDQGMKGGRGAAALLAGADRIDDRVAAGKVGTSEQVRNLQGQQAVTAAVAQKSAAELQREQVREAGAANRAAPAAAESAQRTKGTIATLAAQEQYRKALASGEPKAIQAAEDALRAAQGKWEKAPQAAKFNAVPIPGGTDPVTGMPRGAGAIVVNQATGETRIVSPEEAKGQAAAPKFESGKVYKDASGNRAKWDGKQFVPA